MREGVWARTGQAAANTTYTGNITNGSTPIFIFSLLSIF